MSFQIKAAKNVMASWASLFTHLAVGLFLSPYIVHRLGDEAFGVWILVLSLTGYYGLLDLGIRQSVIRYVAKFSATGDDEQLARFTNTCLFTYTGIAVLVLLVTGVCAWYLPAWFKIPAGLLPTARILVWVAGAGVALSFPLSVFAGILTGLQDFVRPHGTQIGISLLRGLLVLMVLHRGGGLLGLACVTVGLGVLSNALMIHMVPSRLHLRWGWRFIDLQTWRAMIGYSFGAFLVVVAEKLRFQSDAVVVGAFLSSGAITYFAVGSKLVEYATAVVQGMSQIFTPMSSQFAATGDMHKLRQVFVAGNRACALTIFPLCILLIVLGKPIIVAWMGAKYLVSYTILLVLLLPKTLYLAQASSAKILLGMGQHQRLATVLLMEGAANLILSLILVRPLGIMGVALGTAIPLLCTSLVFLPRHLCRLLNVSLRDYLREAYLLPLLLLVPLSGLLLAFRFLLPAHNRSVLCLQIAAAGVVYAAGFAWLFLSGGVTTRGWLPRAQGVSKELSQREGLGLSSVIVIVSTLGAISHAQHVSLASELQRPEMILSVRTNTRPSGPSRPFQRVPVATPAFFCFPTLKAQEQLPAGTLADCSLSGRELQDGNGNGDELPSADAG